MDASRGPQPHIRHHRQQLIPGWRQDRISVARLGIVGDGPYPASFFLAAASALGVRRFLIICPELHDSFVAVAQTLEPAMEWVHLRGWLTHPAPAALLTPCSVIVDFSQLGLTNKILFNTAREHSIPLITVRFLNAPLKSGFRFWSYSPGKETAVIHAMVSERSLSAKAWQDAATAMAAAGLALEEVKRVLFGQPQTSAPVDYVRPNPRASLENLRVALVGAGALGNFAAATLALCGCRHLTLFDPDRVDVTNLNRQIFFTHDVGSPKAPALAHRLNTFFGTQAQGIPQAVDEGTDLSAFDAILDCVDNFETRRLLSLRAQQEGKILISGGTGPDRGQVVAYHPHHSRHTPAQLLDLDGILSRRQREGEKAATEKRPVEERILLQRGTPSDILLEKTFSAGASCLVQADPSVVMSNQIMGALMADALRRMLSGERPGLIFYESTELQGVRLMSVTDTEA